MFLQQDSWLQSKHSSIPDTSDHFPKKLIHLLIIGYGYHVIYNWPKAYSLLRWLAEFVESVFVKFFPKKQGKINEYYSILPPLYFIYRCLSNFILYFIAFINDKGLIAWNLFLFIKLLGNYFMDRRV